MSDNTFRKTDLLFLLYRLGEPLYYPKGNPGSQVSFNVGNRFFIPDYQAKAVELQSRFGAEDDSTSGRKIDIDALLTDALTQISIDDVTVVDRRELFSHLMPKHSHAAGRLIEIFMGLETTNDLIAFAAYVRDRINPSLFAYALCAAMLHRPDTRDLRPPSIAEMFPQKFVYCSSIEQARERANIFQDSSDRPAVEISPNLTGNDSDPEHRLAYFREDIGINLHHWHWHLVYPFDGPENIVKKDRRGELFYYLHQQILARYNVERLCNQLDLTSRLMDWSEPIKEAYFPMLFTSVAGRSWPGRPANMKLANINRVDTQLIFDLEDLRIWKDNILQAIYRRRATTVSGEEIRLDNDQGIDIIGNMVEASPVLSPDPKLYGNLHNTGHMLISYIHDPRNNYAQQPGVMSESNTAMRDPIFYRWHAFINDIFMEHKNRLPPYTINELGFDKITISSLEICAETNDTINCVNKNQLNTFMMKSDVDMSRGLDFFPRGPILARMTHLNHEPFVYRMNIFNQLQNTVKVTIRIFMAPVRDFANNIMPFNIQKDLMIEMDKFTKELQFGENKFVRRSVESTVTIPFNQTFRNLDRNRPESEQLRESDRFNFCGCGWPQHMLIPKGTTSGYQMQLFAIVTDFEQDLVEPSLQSPCKPGLSFCGLRDRKYPDKRAMGFPFDRPLGPNINTFMKFKRHLGNIASQNITVVHSLQVRQGAIFTNNAVSATEIYNTPTTVTGSEGNIVNTVVIPTVSLRNNPTGNNNNNLTLG